MDPLLGSDRERIIRVLSAQGALSSDTKQNIQVLFAHGLHPEQACVGSGFMEADRYRACTETETLYSHTRRLQESEEWPVSVCKLIRSLQEEVGQRGAVQLRIRATYPVAEWFLDQETSPFFEMPIVLVSGALACWLRKTVDTWEIARTTLSDGEIIVCTRQELSPAIHPMTWMSLLQDFFSCPQGMLIVVSPDEMIRECIYRETRGENGKERVDWFDIRTEDDQEQALHAALAGRPVVIFVEAIAEMSWLDTATDAAVPVRVIHRRGTVREPQWESYPYGR